MKLSHKHKIGLGAFTLFTTLAFSSISQAQTSSGGDVLVCQENGETNYYLFDMYEAKLKGQLINLGSADLSLKEKIIFAQERYAEIDPTRADLYAAEALKMLQDIEAQEQGQSAPNGLVALFPQELKDIDDADEISVYKDFKEDCKKFQLVRQEKPIAPRDPLYTISQTYWSRLDSDQKVAALYHEVIQKEMRTNGANTSKGARALNRMIMSDRIQNIKSGEYRNFILREDLRSYRYLGLFDTNEGQVITDNDGEIASILSKEHDLNFGSFKLKVTNPRFSGRQFLSAQVLNTFNLNADRSQIQLNENGNLSKGVIESITEQAITLRGLKKSYDGGSTSLTFDRNGKVISIQEDGYYNKPFNPEMRQALNDLIKCSKKLIQKDKNLRLAEILLQTARNQIINEDIAVIKQLTSDCQKRNTTASIQSIDPKIRSIIKNVRYPKAVGCTGKILSMSAAAFLGTKIGLTSMTCEFSDGSRHLYFGPQIGILVGFAVDAIVGKTSFKGTQSIGKGGAILGGGFVEVKAHLGSRSFENKDICSSENPCDEAINKSFGLGAIASPLSVGLIPSIKLLRKKDRYDTILAELRSEILVDKSK